MKLVNPETKILVIFSETQNLLPEESRYDSLHKDEQNWKSKLMGIFLSFVSGLLLLGINTLVKKMELHFYDVLFVSSIIRMTISVVVVMGRGKSVWIRTVDDDKNIHKIRSFLFSLAIVGGIFNLSDLIAITFMPLGDSMTIILSGALPTTVFAAIFLRERFKTIKLICIMLAITGIILVLKPPFLFNGNIEDKTSNSLLCLDNATSSKGIDSIKHNVYYIGAISAVTAMLSNAILRILIKFIVNNKSSSSSEIPLLYHSFGGLFISGVVPAFGGNQRILFPSGEMETYNLWSWLALFIIGFIHTGKLFMRVAANKLIGPVVVSFLHTSEIIIAYFIQVTFFQTPLILSSVTGSGCIIIACIGICLENMILDSLPPKLRNIF